MQRNDEDTSKTSIGFSKETSNSFRIFRALHKNHTSHDILPSYFQEGIDYIENGDEINDHDAQVKYLVNLFFQRYHGLVVPGNLSNIEPGFFEGGNVENINLKRESHRRTKLEIALVKEAIKLGVPILGICGGHQVINVALGGILDDKTELATNVASEIELASSKLLPGNDEDKEFVVFFPHTAIHKIIGKNQKNDENVYTLEYSSHQQAIVKEKLNPVLIVAATDELGIIKAIEMKGHPWVVGTQFHPEWYQNASDPSRNIFTAFIKTCEMTRIQRTLKQSSQPELLLRAIALELSHPRWEGKRTNNRMLFNPSFPEVFYELKQTLAKINPNDLLPTLQKVQALFAVLGNQENTSPAMKMLKEFVDTYQERIEQVQARYFCKLTP